MPEERARQVRATYKRSVSDGNFGTVGAEVSLEWFVENDDDSHYDLEVAQEMLKHARELVLGELRQSNSPNVRRAVGTSRPIAPPSTAATVPDDDDESLPF